MNKEALLEEEVDEAMLADFYNKQVGQEVQWKIAHRKNIMKSKGSLKITAFLSWTLTNKGYGSAL